MQFSEQHRCPQQIRQLHVWWCGFHNIVSLICQHICCFSHRIHNQRMSRSTRWISHHRNCQLLPCVESGQIHRHTHRIAWIGTCDDGKSCSHIGNRARHHTLVQHHLRRQGAIRSGICLRIGNNTKRRLDRCDATCMSRVSQRTADVITQTNRRHSRRQGGRFSTT